MRNDDEGEADEEEAGKEEEESREPAGPLVVSCLPRPNAAPGWATALDRADGRNALWPPSPRNGVAHLATANELLEQRPRATPQL